MSRFGAGGTPADEEVRNRGDAAPSPGVRDDFLHLCDPRTRRTVLESPLELESGERLEGVEIAWRAWGEPATEAVLVCHALTGSADVDDWWPGLLEPGGPLDPAGRYVLCSNVLGGCYGSTGPSRRAPDGRELVGMRFPRVTIRDMVRAQAAWLDAIGVERLSLVIGGSMGGMQVLEWALLFGDRVGAIAPIAVSARHSAWCIGISRTQRRALRSDPAWRGGVYPPQRRPTEGLELAREIAMVSYRSFSSFAHRFGRELEHGGDWQVESYLAHHGQRLRERFDAATYHRLTEAMDSHDVARGRGPLAEVLASIRQPALVLGIDSDVLYPLEEQRELAAGLAAAHLEVVASPHGHDGFLIEQEQVGRALRGFLDRTAAGAPTG